MLISNNFNHYNNYNTVSVSPRISGVRGLATDTVSFGSSDKNKIENKMKRISGLHDPYSDIVMVSDDEFEKYMKKVEKRPNAESMLNLLHGYEENMFEPERMAYSILSDSLREYKSLNPKSANKLDLHDLLSDLYVSSKISLARQQLIVLNDIEESIKNTKGETNKRLTEIFEPVRESIKDDSFRISPLVDRLRNTKGIDKSAKRKILDIMKEFPNSRNSADVFIVNNAHRTHDEIAEAFLTPSRVSIEHIKPESCGGASNISNYLIASKRMNSLRSSTPFNQFVLEHPNVPSQIDRYFRDLVKQINKGGLTYIAMSLPDVTETLRRQSKGLIDIEVDDISVEEKSNAAQLKEQLKELLKKFAK